MTPLYDCKSCGFLSTSGGAYRHIKGVLFCTNCADGYDAGRAPAAEWVREKLPRQPEGDRNGL